LEETMADVARKPGTHDHFFCGDSGIRSTVTPTKNSFPVEDFDRVPQELRWD